MIDTLKTHLFIEFYYRLEKRFLTEHLNNDNSVKLKEYGVFDNAEEITWKVCKYVHEHENDTEPFQLQIKNEWIDNIIIQMNDSFTTTNASYVGSKSYILLSTKSKLARPYIEINRKIVENGQKLFVSVMHELQHAYEDYNRTIKGRERIGQQAYRHGYLKNDGEFDGNKYIIGKILYFIESFEINAYVTQIKAEANFNKRYGSIEDVYDALKNTQSFQAYQVVFRWIDELEDVTSDKLKQEIMSYVSELSNYKFRTYRKFITFLKSKKYKIQSKLDTILPKMAYEMADIGGYLRNNDTSLKQIGINHESRFH